VPVKSLTSNEAVPLPTQGEFGHATTKYPPVVFTVTVLAAAVTAAVGTADNTVPTCGLVDDTV